MYTLSWLTYQTCFHMHKFRKEMPFYLDLKMFMEIGIEKDFQNVLEVNQLQESQTEF